MLKYAFIAAFTLFSVALIALPAAAEIGVQDGHAQTDPVVEQYDFWTRQIDYMKENVKFRRDLEERRKNYTAQRTEVLQQYDENMKAASGSNESGQSDPENEPAGPPAPEPDAGLDLEPELNP